MAAIKIKSNLVHIVVVVMVATSFLVSRQYDMFAIERAVWATVAFSAIFLAGIILIFKPNYFNAQSEKPFSRVLGVLYLLLSITNIVTVWRTFY